MQAPLHQGFAFSRTDQGDSFFCRSMAMFGCYDAIRRELQAFGLGYCADFFLWTDEDRVD